jgi:site-specific recombinase XerD
LKEFWTLIKRFQGMDRILFLVMGKFLTQGICWNVAGYEQMPLHTINISPLSFHSGTKHSFATQRLAQGYDLGKIGEILGHADMKSTRKYAKYQTENLAEVMVGKNKV